MSHPDICDKMASKRNTVALDDDQLAELRAAFDSVSTTHFYVFNLSVFLICTSPKVVRRVVLTGDNTLAATEGRDACVKRRIAICKVGLLSVPVLCLRLS